VKLEEQASIGHPTEEELEQTKKFGEILKEKSTM